jgi:hypothetical protein
MNKSIQRMEKLADKLKSYKDAKCLLGLGSMAQIKRADAYSDMDFFLIVNEGSKENFMNDLKWLAVQPIIYSFKNSNDGYKIMYQDGVYAEFAVFSEKEIVDAHFLSGIIYYKTNDFDVSLVHPNHSPKKRKIDVNYNVNEALTNIYVGLLRLKRGEISNASTFIQVYAYNLILPLFESLFKKDDPFEDPYQFERRIELRFKESANLLSNFRQGYHRNIESAQAMLDFFDKYFDVNERFTE